MLRNHGPDDSYDNMYPLKIENSDFFVIFPKHSSFIAKKLYLLGYTIIGTVLMIIKERLCIKFTVYKYFF
jgi:hypothetical protein